MIATSIALVVTFVFFLSSLVFAVGFFIEWDRDDSYQMTFAVRGFLICIAVAWIAAKISGL